MLTIDVVLSKLQNLKDWPKTKIGIRDNTIRCLAALKGSPTIMKTIFEFSKVHFICWRKTVTSTGENMFGVTVQTSKMYAEVGTETSLDDSYFNCINRHLYDADPIFLPTYIMSWKSRKFYRMALKKVGDITLQQSKAA